MSCRVRKTRRLRTGTAGILLGKTPAKVFRANKSQDVTRCHKSTFPGHGHNPPGSALKYDAPLGRPNRVRYGAEGELPASLTMLRSQCFLGFLKAKSRKSARHLW